MVTQLKSVYQVCIPHTHRDFFTYLAEGVLQAGCRVWVPFRKQIRLGLVIGKAEASHSMDKLKDIEAVIDAQPLLSKTMLDLCHWVSDYYQSPLSEVIPLALPKKYRDGQSCSLPYIDKFQLAMPTETAHSLIRPQAGRQHALIDFLEQCKKPVSRKMILQSGFTTLQLHKLVKNNILRISREVNWPVPASAAVSPPLSINPEQAEAVESILHHRHAYRCFLLQGVTGSGKTEVYLQVIAKVLAEGRQVLVLVPEIGLTPQLLARFSSRLPYSIAVIHSGLNETERQQAWQLASNQMVKLIIGTRAAIFTPMPELGLIVIDEEHDASLKQMEGVRYSARDTALMRAYSANVPIVLGSATPSLESLYNAARDKYQLLPLQQKALTSEPLHYRLIDIRNLPLQQGLAEPTLKVMKEHLQKGNQVLVFINRRGFSPVLLCHQCGWMVDCSSCDAHLTFHRKVNALICHHCGRTQSLPSVCLGCHGRELIPVGAGTQRIHEFLSHTFPEVAMLRIDRDEVRKKHVFAEHLEQIQKGKVQLLVGTQMLAKGHHFPKLTLAVILDADVGFYNQDFRATERLGQLLIQVAGRAGRAERAGEVLIQTHLPQHPLLNCLIQEGYEAFARRLLETREKAQLPPYHYLAVVRAQGKKSATVLNFLHSVKCEINHPELMVMGPAPAPLARKANQYRMQLLIKSPSRALLKTALSRLRQGLLAKQKMQGIRWNIDVDPQDLS